MSTLARPAFRRAAMAVVSACLAVAVLPGLAAAAPETKEPTPAEEPAPAPARAEKCPADSLCTWPEADFTGEISEIPENKQAQCHALPRAAKSAINDSGFAAEFFDAADCGGATITTVAPGAKAPSFIKAVSVRLKETSRPKTSGSGGSGTGGSDRSGTGSGDRPRSDESGGSGSDGTGTKKQGGTESGSGSRDSTTTDDAP